MSPPSTTDAATNRLLAGELAKSMWATAKPQASGSDADSGGITSGAETFATLFTDVLADAIAGVDVPPRAPVAGGGTSSSPSASLGDPTSAQLRAGRTGSR
ncbi:hypothetical protein DSM112329_00027 [Paraconexibacter sp. AEG42_29]|uniref:Flagellar hook-length control protein FliK n=1 Tax=Paraconexibacter sp. AEG42_29 TaxID=2997339 RepID=A0AAU7ANK7_9ACTN